MHCRMDKSTRMTGIKGSETLTESHVLILPFFSLSFFCCFISQTSSSTTPNGDVLVGLVGLIKEHDLGMLQRQSSET